MSLNFRKNLILLIIGSTITLSGCGTALTSEDGNKYSPVEKKSESQDNVSVDTEKEFIEKESKKENPSQVENTNIVPTESKSATSITKALKEGTMDQIPVTLVSTTDGDTIRVMYKGVNEPVRYLLIDTPETNHPRLGKQPFGTEAKELNRSLVTSGDLTLEFDIGEKRDKYGRLLAYVYVDGKSVQEALLFAGLARVAYIYPPNTRYLAHYDEAQQEAKLKRLGFWTVEDYATDSGFTSGHSKSTTSTPSTATGTTEWFDNCTHLRTKYPSGVASDHPAYQVKMDRDNDNYACER